MQKIKNIKISDGTIKIQTEDNKVLSIRLNNDYINKLTRFGIRENDKIEKEINYYNKCTDFSLIPIWCSIFLLSFAILSKTLFVDLILMVCGGMTAMSLLSVAVFKSVSKKLSKQLNNNRYFLELYNYGLNSIKNKSKENSTKISKTQSFSKSQSTYHLNNKEIIQDKVIVKKR